MHLVFDDHRNRFVQVNIAGDRGGAVGDLFQPGNVDLRRQIEFRHHLAVRLSGIGVGDRLVHHLAVGDGDQVVIRGDDAHGAQTDLHHFPVMPAGLDLVAHLEGAVEQQHQSPEDVLQDILGGKADGDPGGGGEGDQGLHLQGEDVHQDDVKGHGPGDDADHRDQALDGQAQVGPAFRQRLQELGEVFDDQQGGDEEDHRPEELADGKGDIRGVLLDRFDHLFRAAGFDAVRRSLGLCRFNAAVGCCLGRSGFSAVRRGLRLRWRRGWCCCSGAVRLPGCCTVDGCRAAVCDHRVAVGCHCAAVSRFRAAGLLFALPAGCGEDQQQKQDQPEKCLDLFVHIIS